MINSKIRTNEHTIRYTSIFQDGSVVRIFYSISQNEMTFRYEMEQDTQHVWLTNDGVFRIALSYKETLEKTWQQNMMKFTKEVLDDLKKDKTCRLHIVLGVNPLSIRSFI